MSKRLNLNSVELLYEIFSLDKESMTRLLLKNTFFIDPANAHEVVFPEFARESREFYKGIKKGGEAFYNGRKVRICDNLKARDAFSKLSGFKLNGSDRNVQKGWEVAHIWGRVYDPDCFTAGWNLCLMLNFLRDLTEEQNSQTWFQQVIKQASFDLFFKNSNSDRPDFIQDQGINLSQFLEESQLNLLNPQTSTPKKAA